MNVMIGYYRRLRSFSPNAKLYILNTLLTGVGTSVQFLFFNLYVLSLGYGQDVIGTLISIQSIVAAIASLAAGKIADGLGHRRSIIIGGTVSALSLLAMTLIDSQAALMGLSVVMGCGNAMMYVVGAPFMTENSTEEERSHLFGVQAATMTVSGVFGSLVAGVLPPLMTNWMGVAPESEMAYRGTLWAAVALGIFALVPILLIRAKKEIPGQIEQDLWRPCCRGRVIAKLLLPPALLALGTGFVIPFLNVFFKLRFDTPAPVLGTLFAASSVVTTLGSLAGPALAERTGKIRAIAGTQFLAVPFLLMMGFWFFFPGAVTGYLVRALLLTAGGPVYSAFLMEQLLEGERVPVNGLLSMVRSGGYAIAAWVSGPLQVTYGFGLIFALTAGTYLAGTAVTYLFFARAEQRVLTFP